MSACMTLDFMFREGCFQLRSGSAAAVSSAYRRPAPVICLLQESLIRFHDSGASTVLHVEPSISAFSVTVSMPRIVITSALL